MTIGGIISPWWLVLPGVVALAFFLAVVLMRGRRIGLLAIGSLIVLVALSAIWTLSFHYLIRLEFYANIPVGNMTDTRGDHIWFSNGAVRLGTFTERQWGAAARRQAGGGAPHIQWVCSDSRTRLIPFADNGGWRTVAKWSGVFEAIAEDCPPPDPPLFKEKPFLKDTLAWSYGHICASQIWLPCIPLSFFPLFWVYRRHRTRHFRRHGFPVTATNATPGAPLAPPAPASSAQTPSHSNSAP